MWWWQQAHITAVSPVDFNFVSTVHTHGMTTPLILHTYSSADWLNIISLAHMFACECLSVTSGLNHETRIETKNGRQEKTTAAAANTAHTHSQHVVIKPIRKHNHFYKSTWLDMVCYACVQFSVQFDGHAIKSVPSAFLSTGVQWNLIFFFFSDR